MARQRQDFLQVGAALDHGIHLDRHQPGCGCGLDAFKYLGNRVVDVVHALEDRIVECVEADRHPLQSDSAKGSRLLLQQRTVGRQRDLESGDRRKLLDQPVDAMPQQRLAAGQADLLHAACGEDTGDARDLFEGQQIGARQERIVAAEHRLRHAIHAAEVAAIGDRDAQVAHRPAEGIEEGG